MASDRVPLTNTRGFAPLTNQGEVMFTFKSLMFLMFVNTVAFCFFITQTWEQGGLLYIVGTIASTVGITLLMCAEGEIE